MKRRQRGSGTIEHVEKVLGDGSTKIFFRPRLSTPEKRKSLGFTESEEAADAMLEAARAEISRATTHLDSRCARGGCASSIGVRRKAIARTSVIGPAGSNTSTEIPSRSCPS